MVIARVLRAMALVAFAVLPGLAVAVCGGDGDARKTPGSGGSPAATPTPDPAKLLQQGADQIQALKSFHFVLNHENGGSPIAFQLSMRKVDGDYVAPDRLAGDVDARLQTLGSVNVRAKVIAIGDRTWITNPFPPHDWVQLSSSLDDLFDPGGGIAAALRGARNPRIAGEEMINGQKTWKIEADADAATLKKFAPTAEPGYTAKGIVWIGQERPLVHRIRLEGPLGPKDAKNINRQVDVSKFDEPVTIEPPS